MSKNNQNTGNATTINAMSYSTGIESKYRWARTDFAENCFKELAIMLAKSDELSTAGIFFPDDLNIFESLEADDACPEQFKSITDAVECGEEGSVIIDLFSNEIGMGGKTYEIDRTIMKVSAEKDKFDHLYFAKDEDSPMFVFIGGNNNYKTAMLTNKESTVCLDEFCSLSVLKNNTKDYCDTYLFVCYNNDLGIVFSQVIQRAKLCTALDLIRQHEGLSKTLQVGDDLSEFYESMKALVEVCGSTHTAIEKWTAESLPGCLDDFCHAIESSPPFTRDTQRALAKYLIAKSAEHLLDAELVGMLSIVNAKRTETAVTVTDDSDAEKDND